eukprot:13337-Eustigmatos_ZCMA.PRE.1
MGSPGPPRVALLPDAHDARSPREDGAAAWLAVPPHGWKHGRRNEAGHDRAVQQRPRHFHIPPHHAHWRARDQLDW